MLVQIQLKAGECVSPMRLFCARLAKVENLKNNWFVMVKHRFWCCPFLATPIWVAHPQLGSIIFCTRIWVGKRLKIQLDWLQYASFWTAFAKCELAVWSLFEFFKKSVSVIFSHYVTSFNCGNKSHWFIKMRVVKLQPLRVFDAHRHHVDCSWNHKVSLKIHEMRAWPRQKKCQYGQVLSVRVNRFTLLTAMCGMNTTDCKNCPMWSGRTHESVAVHSWVRHSAQTRLEFATCRI